MKWSADPLWQLIRFFRVVSTEEDENGCLIWLAGKDGKGYGKFKWRDKFGNLLGQRAPRFSYLIYNGNLSGSLQIDHLCRNHACVNPLHLEQVTLHENVRRGFAGKLMAMRQRAKTHCPSNHPYSAENTWLDRLGHRHCRECNRLNAARRRKVD